MNHNSLNQLLGRYVGCVAVAEYRFHPARKWRFDFAIPEHKIAIEVEGGMHCVDGGRHFSREGILRDMEKYNEATAAGWRLIRVTPPELLSLRTVQLVRRIMNLNKKI